MTEPMFGRDEVQPFGIWDGWCREK